MNLLPTPEQEALVAAVRDAASGLAPTDLARAVADGRPIPRRVWQEVAQQGWFGIGLPETDGGVGYGPVEEALLLRELGRQVVPGPVLPTLLAAHACAAAGLDQDCRSLLTGEQAAAWVVEGAWIIDAGTVEGGRGDLAVSAGPGGVRLHRLPDSLAQLVPVEAGSTLHRVPAPLDPVEGQAGPVALTAPTWWAHAQVLLAASACGVAWGTVEASVAHAGTREQFGQPIGAFQAVKHRCADMAVRAEAAWSQTAYAALRVADARSDADAARSEAAETETEAETDLPLDQQVAAAVSVALDAARRNAADNVQNHGGMGFTWEADAHLFVGRAHTLDVLAGSPVARRRVLLGGGR